MRAMGFSARILASGAIALAYIQADDTCQRDNTPFIDVCAPGYGCMADWDGSGVCHKYECPTTIAATKTVSGPALTISVRQTTTTAYETRASTISDCRCPPWTEYTTTTTMTSATTASPGALTTLRVGLPCGGSSVLQYVCASGLDCVPFSTPIPQTYSLCESIRCVNPSLSPSTYTTYPTVSVYAQTVTTTAAATTLTNPGLGTRVCNTDSCWGAPRSTTITFTVVSTSTSSPTSASVS
ncbi:hypothetical protein BKA62DRAFT_457147 [Auriculariales sp. MPI-PUGE-AT-0066]|nr:hypothetical protein BKA62DRAFT_457147 [Auriculariales sp. MPI-PUGE-AT-0066]